MMFDRQRAPEKAAPETRGSPAAESTASNAASLEAMGGATPAGPGSELPHLDAIQASFGDFDMSDVAFHGDDDGDDAADAIGAYAFARGEDVVGDASDEFTAAHEAAHVVQHRGGGPGDEAHADAVADAVVAGEPAGDLLSEVAAPSDAAADGGGADRLKYTDNAGDHAIDINTLSEAQCWDLLQQNPQAGQRYGEKTFEAGDKEALEARFAATAGSTLTGVKNAFAMGPVAAAALQRKFGKAVDEFVALLDKVRAHPKVDHFDAWLMGNGPKMIASPDSLLDFVNELREIERRADALPDGQKVDVAEQVIPNTDQTADLGLPGGAQVEIKTVREPIELPTDLSGQLGAGFGKFANANGGEVVVYASYREDVQTVVEGQAEKRRSWDRPNGVRKTEIYVGGALKKTLTDTTVERYLADWLAAPGGGRDKATKLELRMQNGKAFTATRGGGGWVIA